jgi:hypothetical protein
LRAFAGVTRRDCAPDAGARAGDDSNVVFEKRHGVSSCSGFYGAAQGKRNPPFAGDKEATNKALPIRRIG